MGGRRPATARAGHAHRSALIVVAAFGVEQSGDAGHVAVAAAAGPGRTAALVVSDRVQTVRSTTQRGADLNQTRVIAFRFPWATKTCRVEIEGPACSKEDVLRAVAEGRARVLAARPA